MAKLSKKNQEWLQEKFGERANFNRVERVLYSNQRTSKQSATAAERLTTDIKEELGRGTS